MLKLKFFPVLLCGYCKRKQDVHFNCLRFSRGLGPVVLSHIWIRAARELSQHHLLSEQSWGTRENPLSLWAMCLTLNEHNLYKRTLLGTLALG